MSKLAEFRQLEKHLAEQLQALAVQRPEVDARVKRIVTQAFADRASALKQAILAVRFGGKVSIPGVYGGMTDAA